MTSSESHSIEDLNISTQIRKSFANKDDIFDNKTKPYECPGNESGKIRIDISAHLPGCWVRKKLISGRFTANTFVTPKLNDGYSLGVAII